MNRTMAVTNEKYDPQADHRVQASSLIERAELFISRDPDKARLMIDAAAVAIAIADHYQRGHRIEVDDGH